MLLKGQVAVITGGASKRGLGLATARLFAEHGARVAILDLDLNAAKEAIASLKGRGHMAIRCDVTKRRECERAIERVTRRYNRLDILLNYAGITSPQRVMQVDDATYDRVFDINMRGTLHMTQAVVPQMRAQRSGSIVNMSSVSAQRGGGVFGGSHYSAAKGAILGYTKACARELGPDNIRVNAICPSMIDTDITGGMLTDERREEIKKSIPMGRIGTADEVAGCGLFLASSLSSYVTGSEIDINGGSHIH
ncbi:MAG: SDR family NAD(P)-dependent oxidoreductase [Beijerinckiaceae bacterium]|nr:SDR family NAD(P)-dependent oxidoreductase [Beijerinckiaceae bacterium]MCZ8299234.1 SDR family NAD(P)-dependent oxidoreductase [Beijerinckiaceae bacterium]